MLLLIFLLVGISPLLLAYPDTERTTSTGSTPAIDLSLQQGNCFARSTDNRYLFVGYGETLKRVDLATMVLTAEQFYDISADSDFSGSVGGCVYVSSTNTLFVSQDDGDLLNFSLDDITAKPVSTTVIAGSLTKILKNNSETTLFIYNETANTLIHYTITSAVIAATTDIAAAFSPDSVTIHDALIISDVSGTTDHIFISTNRGEVIEIAEGQGTLFRRIEIDAINFDTISHLAATPNKSYVYAINSTDKTLYKIFVASGAVSLISDTLAENSTFAGMAIASVTNPTSVYGFISGINGLSIFDTSDDDIFDLGVTDDPDEPLSISGSGPMIATDDGYLFISTAGGEIAVITDNPFVTITEKSYSLGSGLSTGQTVTLSFESDEVGTYEIRTGDIDQSGSLLTDTAGATSGSVSAIETTQSVVVGYDDNLALLSEGDNDVIVFVTDAAGNVGRRGTTISVDAPPSAVTIQSLSFGNQRLYVTFDRLTASDIDFYNIYVDVDSATALSKADIALVVEQPALGAAVTATVSALSNGTAYYVAIEGVDTGGQIGSRTVSTTTASPEETVGLSGFTGESGGCELQSSISGRKAEKVLVGILLLLALWSLRLRERQKCFLATGQRKILQTRGNLRSVQEEGDLPPTNVGSPYPMHSTKAPSCFRKVTGQLLFLFLVAAVALFGWSTILYANNRTPQQWSAEIKGGIWQPTDSVTKSFIGSCCHFTGLIEGGYLYQSQFGIELGAGFGYASGHAKGSASGATSGDSFILLTVPIPINFVYRADYAEDQLLVPYIKAGPDFLYFRERLTGVTTQGLKKGLHVAGGVQVLLNGADPDAPDSDLTMGLNDTFLVVEARYNWINDFSGRGIDLSGLVYTAGLLFEF